MLWPLIHEIPTQVREADKVCLTGWQNWRCKCVSLVTHRCFSVTSNSEWDTYSRAHYNRGELVLTWRFF